MLRHVLLARGLAVPQLLLAAAAPGALRVHSGGGSGSRSSSSGGGSGSGKKRRAKRLVLPARKAAAPPLGRVPPSSAAAAAAAASVLRGAAPPAQPQQQPPPAQPPQPAQQPQQPQPQPPQAQQHPQPQAPPRVAAWEVVAGLRQSAPHALRSMGAALDAASWLAYCRDARLGVPSVFSALGVHRAQGRRGRAALLRREALLSAALEQLGGAGGAARVPDAALRGITHQQLGAAAAAAAARCWAARGADGGDVADALLDYFVFKQLGGSPRGQRGHERSAARGAAAAHTAAARARALARRATELMQLQRRHRELVAARARGGAPPGGEGGGEVEEVEDEGDDDDVEVLDAFFDASLGDYIRYLRAAAAGAPSVFTVAHPGAGPPRGGRRPGGAELAALEGARGALGATAEVLALLPRALRARPALLLGAAQLQRLATLAGVPVRDVREALSGFYAVKRLGFSRAVSELAAAAGDTGVLRRLL
ncbi:hypothetical protein HT031_001972 [Scenedesmus sp. PABB004]|nr:hypothetical protein HT031_001972 [Scenedesmus sp. PABB004]